MKQVYGGLEIRIGREKAKNTLIQEKYAGG
jgi:hypothetical protein